MEQLFVHHVFFWRSYGRRGLAIRVICQIVTYTF